MSTPGTACSPAEARSTVVDGVEVLGSLSPSRAGDFLACPLLYRFRTIDRLPEPPSPEAVRGTLVHKVLEGLFDHPPLQRTPEQARAMVPGAWADLVAEDPGLTNIFAGAAPDPDPERRLDPGSAPGTAHTPDETVRAAWLRSCEAALDRYFSLEDPRRLEPAEREVYVEAVLDSKLLVRGFIDRLDVAANGMVRVVDYKTGRAPGEHYEAAAFFQMRFYALILWRARGVLPSMLQLIYLGSGEVLRAAPDEAELLATERKIEAIWAAIRAAESSGDWRPRPSALCGWCAHQALCPAFGGTPPELPPLSSASQPPVAPSSAG